MVSLDRGPAEQQAYVNGREDERAESKVIRPGGHLNAQTVHRIREAAASWELLWSIWNKFGPSPDGAVERDMRSAESRLRDAIRVLDVIASRRDRIDPEGGIPGRTL